jgi:hypothetical protein
MLARSWPTNAVADRLARPDVAVCLQIRVEPLAKATHGVGVEDEIVGPAADAESDGEPATGHAVDTGEFLGQQRSGPGRREQHIADQLDAAGGTGRGGQRDVSVTPG